ncbi:MAG TPA: LTA synthase family protein [Pseudomonas sp.]|uniref:LTA synthase family protein n=1 Tax=Pseudomonas sp. TaxID=306 RepID=UPI002B482731|nr:LTA synthase family protein [Pseudomonas sp.]HKS14100.1 LTA synthase family protein [Pseudomonas sp.]
MMPVAAVGLLLTVLVERLLVPRPPLRRPLACWGLHAGLWCVGLALLLGLTARPLFSGVNLLLVWLLIVMVSNAKYHSLREPFVCADFEYFSDAVRFPRLYLPFFGFGKAALLAVGFLAYLWAGLKYEPAVAGVRLEALGLGLGGLVLLGLGRGRTAPSFDAEADVRQWGLAASLWRYFWAARAPVDKVALGSPFSAPVANTPDKPLPDLVSVQSESFFDVRGLWPGVKPGVLGEYDRLAGEALARGKLQVAAWGANTVRTEFAYLTGIAGDRLGVHRFNPYRVLARQGLPSIAAQLRRLGYRTVCIHPYDGSFYGRDKVLPALGFDEFIDVRSFDESQKAGPFIGDCAVADKIRELLQAPGRTQPLFIHAVTMENHGPLHLETVEAAELPTWFDRPLLAGMDDLAPYLRHIGNADRMLGKLRETLTAHPREALLCFYGDHVPILPNVYQAVGAPAGDTDYLIWSNRQQPGAEACPMRVEALSSRLLGCALEQPVRAPMAGVA